MDRSVLEADPHAVLEGMIIAAKAIGAHQGLYLLPGPNIPWRSGASTYRHKRRLGEYGLLGPGHPGFRL